jgi:hypothetical protein
LREQPKRARVFGPDFKQRIATVADDGGDECVGFVLVAGAALIKRCASAN